MNFYGFILINILTIIVMTYIYINNNYMILKKKIKNNIDYINLTK